METAVREALALLASEVTFRSDEDRQRFEELLGPEPTPAPVPEPTPAPVPEPTPAPVPTPEPVPAPVETADEEAAEEATETTEVPASGTA